MPHLPAAHDLRLAHDDFDDSKASRAWSGSRTRRSWRSRWFRTERDVLTHNTPPDKEPPVPQESEKAQVALSVGAARSYLQDSKLFLTTIHKP